MSSNAAPLFSVIVPTYNRPNELRQCLRALQDQDTDEWTYEVLVVDDGGSSDLEPIIESERGDRNMRLIRQTNAGPGAARNRGMQEARGRYLAFTDDDCRPEPGWLKAYARVFETDPNAMLGGRTVNALESNPYASTSQLVADLVYDYYNPDPNHAWFFISNNMAFPADGLRECGGFAPGFRVGAEDRELCDRWRMERRPIRFVADANIRHAHDLTLRSFAKQHFNYGRGASRYHRLRRQRGSGRMREDLSFHRQLPGAVMRRLKGTSLTFKLYRIALLAVWQIANAWGFFYEELRGESVQLEHANQGASDTED